MFAEFSLVRHIGKMRIVQMYPAEEWLSGICREPLQSPIDDDISFGPAGQFFERPAGAGQIVVGSLKSLIETKLCIEDKGADEGPGAITARFQGTRQRRHTAVHLPLAVRPQA